ncbi:hypothetical protein F4779DRAFT_640909 [Xylariaceae sp. FL0662B]|nr:hypothetical protein F4779DRAFT_640909 [Xylariaceae sp. FL0662B]
MSASNIEQLSRVPEAIAIIGSGCRFPGNASTPSRLWDILRAPTDMCRPMPESRVNAAGFYHPDSSYHGHTNVKDLKSYFLSEEGIERRFDARFFGIKSAEANVMDPQVRLLLETTYEALEAAGQTIEGLQGSDTSCFVGLMLGDYEQAMLRDEGSMGDYHITGVARSLMSNRLSYFFDWRGQSMTIDTACSSSLVAVHQAVQVLRSAAMLSPDGQSRMWDASANGYGRGEGVAAIIMKRLADAEADGDLIECVIRETALNQDGRTKGITMPNPDAQQRLIRDCYRRAGLDLGLHKNRPQYFEAHGTGTPAGDPAEAEAISTSFFANFWQDDQQDLDQPLLVGSVKTVIGHTEGAAGLAAIMKASLALQHAEITPNLHFDNLNPQIRPFYTNLSVPTSIQPWPVVEDGEPRRASVNSFGFGGSNAHAILESYTPRDPRPAAADAPVFSPFIFSAASAQSLSVQMTEFSRWLGVHEDQIDIRNLAYTLHSRRSRLPFSTAIAASTHQQLCEKLINKVEMASKDQYSPVSIRVNRELETRKPTILGVFTGQGAQWTQMGAQLIRKSAAVQNIVQNLEDRLLRLPKPDRPTWSLREELLKDPEHSRITEATFSHPLCAAIQIVLVDILRITGIEFDGVVGHSSGEVGAAYAAGFISAEDAICVAYYRGLHSKLASDIQGQPGSMMVVEMTYEDALDLCELPDFQGRVSIAAYNSSSSLTIAGDRDAIYELKVILDDEKKFARVLRVDKAYHSHHMTRCSAAYLDSLRALDIRVGQPGKCAWFSSVYEDDVITQAQGGGIEALKDNYWEANMVRPVLFMQAIKRSYKASGAFDLAIEVGPHPTLQDPALQTLQAISGGTQIPYTGMLRRSVDDLESLAEGVGYAWVHLGRGAVNLQAYDQFLSGGAQSHLIKGLPTYPWDHDNQYWHESRFARAIRGRQDTVHELLGHMTPDSTKHEMRWRNVLHLRELPWLEGHRLQNQTVFPAAGYVVLALEAACELFKDNEAQLVEVVDFDIRRALTFDEDAGVETLFSISNIQRYGKESITADFKYYASVGTHETQLDFMAGGDVKVTLGAPFSEILPPRGPRHPNLIRVKQDDFYDSLHQMEYQYSGPFRGLSGLERKLGVATGFIEIVPDSNLLVHPATLDVAFQAILLAHSAPYDGRIWAMHVPKAIRRISFNPRLCQSSLSRGSRPVPFESVQSCNGHSSLIGDVDLFDVGTNRAIIQVEGLSCVPFSPATADDDRELYSTIVWAADGPDARMVASLRAGVAEDHDEVSQILERVAFFYLQNLEREIPSHHPSRVDGPLRGLFRFAAHIASLIEKGRLPFWRDEWYFDTHEIITRLCEPYGDIIDFVLLNAMGKHLPSIVKGEMSAIEIGMKDGYLAKFYANALGIGEYPRQLGRVIKQITHRFPRMNMLEIGAGTGAATSAVFEEIGLTFSSYTYTDISPGFFGQAQKRFRSQSSRMVYKVLDISKDPRAQGYTDHSYDLVIASLVLHATHCLEQTMRNTRRLLRPNGWLVVMELTSNDVARSGTIFGAFHGWWLGSNDGRPLGPAVSGAEWDSLLRNTGFSGCDTITSTASDGIANLAAVWATQAVDDHVTFLRDPLYPAPKTLEFANIKDLVIIGGLSSATSKVAEDLRCILEQHCVGGARRVKCLTQILSEPVITTTTTVVSLSDIDQPLFQCMTEAKFEAMKAIIRDAATVLWVTEGRRAKNPHSNMTAGFMRSVLEETPSLAFQLLDFEECGTLQAKAIAGALIRFRALTQWQQQASADNILTTIEPELVLLGDGTTLIPRLVPNTTMNDRYNSSRREIFRQRDVNEHDVTFEIADGGGLSLRENLLKDQTDKGCLRVKHSHLSRVNVADLGYVFVSLCEDYQNSTDRVALSAQLGTSICPLATLPVPGSGRLEAGSEAYFMLLVALKLVSLNRLLCLSHGETLLVHDPESALAAILEEEARNRNIRIIFTSEIYHRGQSGWIIIDRHAPDRKFREVIPRTVAAFLDCSSSSENTGVGARIASYLPPHCIRDTLQAMFSRRVEIRPDPPMDIINDRLEVALGEAFTEISTAKHSASFDIDEVHPAELQNYNQDEQKLAVINWSFGSHIPVQIQPIDIQPLLSGSKTYWLAGLSGGLGLSLCEWMISRGAKNIVITSREPNIDRAWLGTMSAVDVTVRVYSNDLTDRKQVESLYDELCSSMPPLAGVAQGAMVLEDTPIRDMTRDIMLKVTRPKVEGSINLHEVIGNTPLEFLIFFSPVGSVVGRVGQANYSAANWFMASLAEQRHRLGLPASIIHIGPILGAGYIAEIEAGTQARHQFTRTPGFEYLSEGDVHQQFAEAILAGRSGSMSSVDSVTGLKRVRFSSDNPPVWVTNPFMSHFILQNEAIDPGLKTANSGTPLKARLDKATTRDQVLKMIRDEFVPKLCTLFRLDVGEIMMADLNNLFMDEIGIDSLIAVNVRTWWMKALNVNIPVLKILSGISVGELIALGVDALDPAIIPGIQDETLKRSTRSEGGLDLTLHSPSVLKEGSSTPGATPLTDATYDELSFSAPITNPESVELADAGLCNTSLVGQPLELSFSQSMFWFASAIQQGKTGLNHTGSFRLTGTLQLDDLRNAISVLGQRHDAIRTCFFIEDGRPRKNILETSQVCLEHRHIADEERVKAVVEELHNYAFDIENGETMRIVLLSTSSTVHYLLISTNSLVMDGFSGVILLRELFQLYSHQPVSNNILQYSSYGESQREAHATGQFESELSFWKGEFQDFPPALPILRISRVVTRPILLGYENERVDLRVDSHTKASINRMCCQYKVTPFHFYLSTLRALLVRYTDEEDITIGVGDANRVDESSMESLGPYINLLSLRFRTAAYQGFGDILQETRLKMYSALSNSRLPFQVLLNEIDIPRSATHTPMFQCFIDYRLGFQEKQQWGDLELEMCSFQASRSPYDLALDIIDNPESDCLLMFVARKDLYSKEEVEILAKSYEILVKWFVTEPDTALSSPQIHRPDDITQAVAFARGPSRIRQWPSNLVGRIDIIAQQKSDKPAVRSGNDIVMTYSELAQRSHDIAAALKTLGVVAGSRIALLQEPTFDWIASILGILRIGAVYVPLDLCTLRQRLGVIINDCRPSIILTDKDAENEARELSTHDIQVVNVASIPAAASTTPIPVRVNDLAMILYTSGSSGVPKGILLRHEGLRNWIEQAGGMCDIEDDEVVLQQSSSSFDMSFTQIFTALCFGGSVYLLPRSLRGDAHAITELIATGKVSFTSATPSEYFSWLKYGLKDQLLESSWRRALCAGEPVDSALLGLFASLGKGDLRFFNSYGPTEISLVATAVEINIKRDFIPSTKDIVAGYPLPNYSVYVLDANHRPVPPGVQGEIYVGGAGIAAGYIGNPSLTTEKFIADPFAPPEYRSQGWAVMHRTGDLGRWRQDGAIFVEGRILGDTQVKLRGQRIDLREVEVALIKASHEMLGEAVVSLRHEVSQECEVLVAHVKFESGISEQSQGQCLRTLAHTLPLPRYMWPAAIVPVDHLPMTSSGKLDRKVIAELTLPKISASEDDRQVPLTDTESQLMGIWKNVVSKEIANLHRFTPETDFFHVGGTSLLLLSLQAHICSVFGAKLPLIQMFESSSLGGMARRIRKQEVLAESFDWEQETQLSPATLDFRWNPPFIDDGPPKVVILTGATGFLGQAFLRALIEDPSIQKICCIAVRNLLSRHHLRGLSKVQLYEGDLTLPHLGLDNASIRAIFSEANLIIHNGADVSHLKTFQSLRQANLQATKELIEMSLPRRVPIHYISTGGTCTYSGLDEFGEESMSAYPPPLDAFDGYTASKWASERYLEKVHEHCGWPICIHRPSSVVRNGDTTPELDLMQSLLKYSRLMRAVPQLPNLRGALDLVSLDTVVQSVMREIKEQRYNGCVRFVHEGGNVQLKLDKLKEFIEDDGRGNVEELPPAEWAGRARGQGLHDILVTFFENLTGMRPVTYPRLVSGTVSR